MGGSVFFSHLVDKILIHVLRVTLCGSNIKCAIIQSVRCEVDCCDYYTNTYSSCNGYRPDNTTSYSMTEGNNHH